jgi:hypothetical protein
MVMIVQDGVGIARADGNLQLIPPDELKPSNIPANNYTGPTFKLSISKPGLSNEGPFPCI